MAIGIVFADGAPNPLQAFCPDFRGFPSLLTGRKRTAIRRCHIPFASDSSCRFSRLQGLAIKGESVATPCGGPVPTLVLGPFRVLHVVPCRPPLPAPAALVLRLSCDRSIAEPALARCPGLQRFVPRPPCVRSILRWKPVLRPVPNLYPPGRSTLQGFPPVCRFLPFPAASPFAVHRPSGFVQHPGRHLHNLTCIRPGAHNVFA